MNASEERTIAGLHVRTVGAGPPLLMLHGLGGSVITWSKIEAAMAAEHLLIMVDLRGFGRSAKPLDWPYGLHDHARDILALIEHLDLRDLAIVGNSLGGGVALLVALGLVEAGSDRLRGLVLLDSIAAPQRLPFFVAVLRAPLLGPAVLRLLPSRWGVLVVLGLVYRRFSRIEPAFVKAYAEPLNDRDGRHALVATARGMIPPDIGALLDHVGTIQTPALLIWGRQDRLVPLRVGEELLAKLPDARLEILEDCGHAPQEERPAETARLLTTFLDSLCRT